MRRRRNGACVFDHMLDLLARHSLMDLTLQARGDLEVDAHHTVEDVGIVLGNALKMHWGQKGHCSLRLFLPAHG